MTDANASDLAEPSAALAARCAALQAPVVGIVSTILYAGMDPARAPELLTFVKAASSVLAEGTDGITERAYLDWHPIGVRTFAAMADAIERDEVGVAIAAMREPDTGLHLMGAACAGCSGW